jgi:Zn-dependent metalloprotease
MRRHLHHPLTVMLALFLLVFLLLAASSPAMGKAEENDSEIGANEPILDRGAVSPPRQEPDPDTIQRLIDDSGGTAVVSLNSATGVASFVRLPQGVELPSTLSARTSVNERANDFLAQYGGAFGITNTGTELKYVSSHVDSYGNTQVVYQQVYQGVDVFAGVLKVHFDESNQITAVNGTFVPKIGVRSTPELSADTAGRIAVDTVAGTIAQRNASHDLRAVNSQLYVYASGLAQGLAGPVHLVYEVEVTNPALTVREFVYVDAHSGAIVDRISGIHEGLNREVSETDLANVVWVEGDPFPTGNVDWDNEIKGAGETYNLFASMAGRDSYDAAGATMRTVNNDPTINCPNANWNGTSTNYCTVSRAMTRWPMNGAMHIRNTPII